MKTPFRPSRANRTKTHHFFQFELDFLWGELLAQSSLPQQHVTVVCQQLRTLWLRLSLHTHTGWTHTHTCKFTYTPRYCDQFLIREKRHSTSARTKLVFPLTLSVSKAAPVWRLWHHWQLPCTPAGGGQQKTDTTYHCSHLLLSWLCSIINSVCKGAENTENNFLF